MTKVKRISVMNLKAVSELTANFEGMTAILTGGNNKGKTTFLRSLPDRLRGIKPDVIVKHNETNGKAEYELTSGEKFIWEFDVNGKEKLTYISERNIPSKITKEISNTYFPPVFDVDKFLSDTPANQKKVLQKLTGLDFTDIDNAYKLAYEERTYANKRAGEEKIKHESNLPDPSIKETETAALEQELSGIEAHNAKYDKVLDGVKLRGERVKEISNDIAELEKKILRLQETKTALEKEISDGNEWMQKKVNEPKTNKEELSKKLDSINRNNQAIQLRESYLKAKDNAEQADLSVKKIEADKLEMIRLAEMPEGFGFDDNGITYNGFAFNRQQLSSSGVYIAALKLALLQIGEVKTLFFDASYLDKNSLAEVEQWANNNDLQLLIERPSYEGGEITYEILNNG